MGPDTEDARYEFSRLLEENELEYATDKAADRFIVPTASGLGIVVEFFILDIDDRQAVCAALIMPLLFDVLEGSLDALAFLSHENGEITFGRFIVSPARGVLEARWDLLCDTLDSTALLFYLGALSQHATQLERLEQLFGGSIGPTYDALLGGA